MLYLPCKARERGGQEPPRVSGETPNNKEEPKMSKKKRQEQVKTIRNGVWYTLDELAKIITAQAEAVTGGEGWSEGALPIRPAVVKVTESQVAAARAKRLAAEEARKVGSANIPAVVVPSLTEREIAQAKAEREAREAARREAKRAEFAHKVLLAKLARTVVAV